MTGYQSIYSWRGKPLQITNYHRRKPDKKVTIHNRFKSPKLVHEPSPKKNPKTRKKIKAKRRAQPIPVLTVYAREIPLLWFAIPNLPWTVVFVFRGGGKKHERSER